MDRFITKSNMANKTNDNPDDPDETDINPEETNINPETAGNGGSIPVAPETEKPKQTRKRNTSSASGDATTKKAKQSNPIWEYFTRVKTATSDTASCKIRGCTKGFTISKGSIAGIDYHLKKDHAPVYAMYLKTVAEREEEKQQQQEEILQAQATLEYVTQQKKTSNTLEKYFVSKYPIGDKRQLAFDKTVIEYIVETSLPFGHVESEGFKNFVANLNPRANIKTAKTFATTKLPKLYEAMKFDMDKKTKKDFAIDVGVGFTSDCWTSRANDPFMSLTLHYVSPQWELVRVLVACIPFEGRHTAVRLAAALDETIKSIQGLSIDPKNKNSPKTVVHDAAANMIATIPKSGLGLQSFVCMDHRLQTILRKTFKDNKGLNDLIKKATKLASKCHQSALTCEKIRAEAKQLDEPYVKVQAPVATRWNSNFMMISSIMKLKKTLISLKEKGAELDLELFDNQEYWCLGQLEDVLGRFDVASQELSADKTCTMPLILITLFNLVGGLEIKKTAIERMAEDSEERFGSVLPTPQSKRTIFKVVKDLLVGLEQEWPDCGAHDDPIRVGHFLHPFYRGMLLKKFGTELNDVQTWIIDNHPTTLEHNEKKKNKDSKDSQQSEDLFEDIPSEDISEAYKQFLALEKDDEAKEEDFDENPPIEDEIDRYLALPRPAEKSKVDILKWWQDHEKVLPLLSHFAKTILAIPASSASSERTFSAAGNIVTAQRYNLDPKTTQVLTWCQQNWKVLKRTSWDLQEDLDEKTEDDITASQPFVPTQASSGDGFVFPEPGPSRGLSVRSTTSTLSGTGSVGSYQMTPRHASQHY